MTQYLFVYPVHVSESPSIMCVKDHIGISYLHFLTLALISIGGQEEYVLSYEPVNQQEGLWSLLMLYDLIKKCIFRASELARWTRVLSARHDDSSIPRNDMVEREATPTSYPLTYTCTPFHTQNLTTINWLVNLK